MIINWNCFCERGSKISPYCKLCRIIVIIEANVFLSSVSLPCLTTNNNLCPENYNMLSTLLFDSIRFDSIQRGRSMNEWMNEWMIFTQEAPLTRKWFSGRSCIRSNWNKLGVNFEEGGNRSARRKPSKSGWDRLKLNPHTTFFVVEVEGVIDVHYASLTSRSKM